MLSRAGYDQWNYKRSFVYSFIEISIWTTERTNTIVRKQSFVKYELWKWATIDPNDGSALLPVLEVVFSGFSCISGIYEQTN